MENGNTNWGQSVTGVVIKDNQVLLGRHTYGGGNGKLIFQATRPLGVDLIDVNYL